MQQVISEKKSIKDYIVPADNDDEFDSFDPDCEKVFEEDDCNLKVIEETIEKVIEEEAYAENDDPDFTSNNSKSEDESDRGSNFELSVNSSDQSNLESEDDSKLADQYDLNGKIGECGQTSEEETD